MRQVELAGGDCELGFTLPALRFRVYIPSGSFFNINPLKYIREEWLKHKTV
jgi:hypothetical protein